MKTFTAVISTLVICCFLYLPTASASVICLDFEGLENYFTVYDQQNNTWSDPYFEPVDNFYNGGDGTNYGISFTNAYGLIDKDASGDQYDQYGSGNFANEPSPSTIMFFYGEPQDPINITMTVASGFDTGFSFYYTAWNSDSTNTPYVNIFGDADPNDGTVATTDLLATMSLTDIPLLIQGDPNGLFQFSTAGISFDGTAYSAQFGGTAGFIGFDNITLGSSAPVPEPTTLALLGIGLLGFGVIGRKKMGRQ